MKQKIPDNAEEVMEVMKLFLTTKPAREQLHFWELFRTTHRARIANTEAPLCPELLTSVDEHIERLRKAV